MNNLGVYVHIPFCLRKCNYCDFLSSVHTDQEMESYVNVLCEEIKLRGKQFSNRVVDTLFIGGGTPSILSPKLLEQVLGSIRDNFSFNAQGEYSIECNPGTVDREKLSILYKYGINRLSFGLQATQNSVLKELGRIHTFEQFLSSYEMARACGFSNINIDLMEALPGQSEAEFLDGLKTVVGLKPEHISVYSLIIEEGTKFFETYNDNPPYDEESERNLYWHTHDLLAVNGYQHYEISNYCLPGFECKHNLKYWNREDYIGLGLGAASMIGHERFTNSREWTEYPLFSPETENLTHKHELEETMFLGLRKCEGVLLTDELKSVYEKQIHRLINEQLLVMDGQQIKLTNHGLDISNYVMSEFIMD